MLKGKLASGDVFTLDGDVVSCTHEDMQDVLRDSVLHEYSLDYFPSERSQENMIAARIIADFGGEILQASDLDPEKEPFPSDNLLTMH